MPDIVKAVNVLCLIKIDLICTTFTSLLNHNAASAAIELLTAITTCKIDWKIYHVVLFIRQAKVVVFLGGHASPCHCINPNWSSWQDFACDPIALAESHVHHGVAPSWPTVTGVLISHYCVTVQGLFKHIGRDVEQLQHTSVCNWGMHQYHRALCRHLMVLANLNPWFAHSWTTFCSSNLS